MADYGALAGLGEGLMQFGTSVFKSEMAKKLEADRDAKEEQRTIAKEDRTERRLRAKPDPSQSTFVERDGALFRQQRNVYGDVLDESLASADEIDKRNYTREKQKNELDLARLNVEGKGLTNQFTQTRIDSADSKLGLEQELLRARTEQARKTGDAALLRAANTGKSGRDSDSAATGSMSEYANLLKKEAKDVIAQYAAEDESLTATEINRVTRQAVEQAAKFGLEPQELLEQLLEERNYGKPR